MPRFYFIQAKQATIEEGKLQLFAANNKVASDVTIGGALGGDIGFGAAENKTVSDVDVSSAGSSSLLLSQSGNNSFIYNRNTSGQLRLGAGGASNNVVIDTSGRVMIGTTTAGSGDADDLTVATSGHG